MGARIVWRSLLVLLVASVPVHAIGPAHLVKDLNTTSDPSAESNPRNFIVHGAYAYFSADDGLHGMELWRTDGTATGTRIVLDLYPGAASSHAFPFGALGDLLLFAATEDTHGSELWVTDGSPGGTRLVQDINPGSDSSDIQPLGYTNGRLLFAASEPSSGRELWISDGSSEGTALLKDIVPGASSTDFLESVSAGDYVYFVARKPGAAPQLWVSDGTAQGTSALLTSSPGSPGIGAYPNSLVALHDVLLFAAFDGVSQTLWRSQGTPATTQPIAPRLSAPKTSTVTGNWLYYFTSDNELWRTDGTQGGTSSIARFTLPVGANELTALGDVVYFAAATTNQGTELWRSDGTLVGTHVVADIVPGRGSGLFPRTTDQFLVHAGKIYFSAQGAEDGLELWASDGTEEGTQRVRDISNPPGQKSGSAPMFGVELGDAIIFSASEFEHGRELWRSDGTEIGTTLVTDIYAKNRGGVFDILTADDEGIYFFVADLELNRSTLWRSDGSEQGTRAVKLIRDGTPSFFPQTRQEGKVIDKILFFSADDGVHGNELWRSDATEDGTYMVRDLLAGEVSGNPRGFAQLQGALLFIADDELQHGRLWRSDGTDAGTVPLTSSEQGDVFGMGPVLGDRLIVHVHTPSNHYVPWLTDGTTNGTTSLQGEIADPLEYTYSTAALGNGLVLSGSTDAYGDEIYFTDGTAAGTRLVRDIVPEPTYSSFAGELASVANAVVFEARELSGSQQLWRTDGTAPGTVAITAFPDAFVWFVTASTGDAYFIRSSSTTQELWRSDGSIVGTRPLKTLPAGSGISPPFGQFTAVGDALFFAMHTVGFGEELWFSDGTPAGTTLIADIAPGGLSSMPRRLTPAGGQLFFIADDQKHGNELWALPLGYTPVPTPTPTPTRTPTTTRTSTSTATPSFSATPSVTATATPSLTPTMPPPQSGGSGCALSPLANSDAHPWIVLLLGLAVLIGQKTLHHEGRE